MLIWFIISEVTLNWNKSQAMIRTAVAAAAADDDDMTQWPLLETSSPPPANDKLVFPVRHGNFHQKI
jgi:hypothetical protein